MTAVALSSIWVDLARGLREAFFMFWETLWALVLGFTLSGVVQRFVSRDAMRRSLGDHRTGSVLRASGLGMVSSSCSYAATSMARSLVARGADFLAAMVFMFASTNLVVELGVVLLVLLGWQFVAAQFAGGALMIVLLVALGGLVLRGRAVVAARERLVAASTATESHDPVPGVGGHTVTWGAMADAATYTVADVTMLRRELILGYGVAGCLAVLVPAHAWDALFLHGHGVWTSLENALVAPLIAVASWVCSVGNVPLATALWSGGISFGGVIAFIFADLIAFPMLLIYRRFYGARLTLRLVAVFYVVMVLAGLGVGAAFSVAGIVPATRPVQVAPTHFEWNYTTFLNLVFGAIGVAVYVLHRSRSRLGGGVGLAADPVCGMQVRIDEAPATTTVGDTTVSFCSERCRDRFTSGTDRDDVDPKIGASGSPTDHAAPSATARS